MEEFHQEGLFLAPSSLKYFFKLIVDLNLEINPTFLFTIDFQLKNNDSFYFTYWLMNISPHLLIDIVILSAALTMTLILRAKGNAKRKEK